ncbi:MAG: ASCH domain-containing protein [Paludibacter sp.]
MENKAYQQTFSNPIQSRSNNQIIMLLTFSKQQFVDRILSGDKIHTIREDKTNRWKAGTKIHFWKGNPRNVKNNPYQFATGTVRDTLTIQILPNENKIHFPILGTTIKSLDNLNRIAKSDGFDNWEEMKNWFNTDFRGKLIFFENVKP